MWIMPFRSACLADLKQKYHYYPYNSRVSPNMSIHFQQNSASNLDLLDQGLNDTSSFWLQVDPRVKGCASVAIAVTMQ